MDHQDLLTHLARLAGPAVSDSGPAGLDEQLAGLVAALQQAVSGYAGLRLIVVHSGHPVTLTATVQERVDKPTTSLGIALPRLSTAHEAGGRMVFYSTVPGAFVDLAADLTYALNRGTPGVAAVELDVDLPLAPSRSGLTGLDDLITLNRAAGVLIGHGHHPDTAQQDLSSRAAAAGLTTLAFAAQILRR